ncbi:hypothetical protein [Yoonia sediminilitoris]|uniref:Uncharacterized protein n=1 Tax=Yoonia sediminilitoris TaxID=1286148 RepID=A0A2T6KKD7_9RHOB|nr:hypothetical protein [Yoonia sediminilitoris]PUB16416.1 hypothetical protein C8N45_103272 [Yoonia sediminilitoris]RCW96765.1 hypothetical protein DFP92_103272 [Yoonia sediminilitoris]
MQNNHIDWIGPVTFGPGGLFTLPPNVVGRATASTPMNSVAETSAAHTIKFEGSRS